MARKIMSSKKKVRDLGYPTMQGVFREWETDIEIVDREKTIDENGFNVVSEVYRKVRAVVKPLEMSAIMIKPEALRERRWIFVYIETQQVQVVTNDVILWKGDRYRITDVLDHTMGHFIKYHAVLEEGIV